MSDKNRIEMGSYPILVVLYPIFAPVLYLTSNRVLSGNM